MHRHPSQYNQSPTQHIKILPNPSKVQFIETSTKCSTKKNPQNCTPSHLEPPTIISPQNPSFRPTNQGSPPHHETGNTCENLVQASSIVTCSNLVFLHLPCLAHVQTSAPFKTIHRSHSRLAHRTARTAYRFSRFLRSFSFTLFLVFVHCHIFAYVLSIVHLNLSVRHSTQHPIYLTIYLPFPPPHHPNGYHNPATVPREPRLRCLGACDVESEVRRPTPPYFLSSHSKTYSNMECLLTHCSSFCEEV
jgi:hypothetical protein